MFKAKIYYSPKSSPDKPYCLHIIHVNSEGFEDGMFPPSMYYYDSLEDAKYVPNLFKYEIELIRC